MDGDARDRIKLRPPLFLVGSPDKEVGFFWLRSENASSIWFRSRSEGERWISENPWVPAGTLLLPIRDWVAMQRLLVLLRDEGCCEARFYSNAGVCWCIALETLIELANGDGIGAGLSMN